MSAHYLYRCYAADGRLLYVGISKDVFARLKQHRSRAFWAADVVHVKATVHRTEIARILERRAIRDEHPRFNNQGRWETRHKWNREDWTDYIRTVLGAQFVNRGSVNEAFQGYAFAFGEQHPLAEGVRREFAARDAESEARWAKQRAVNEETRRRVTEADHASMLEHLAECETCRAEGDYSVRCPESEADAGVWA